MLNLKVHEYGKVQLPNGETRVTLTRYSPYATFSEKEGEDIRTVYAQGGQFYDQSGKPLENVPDWAKDSLNKMSPQAKKDIGFGEDEPEAPRPRPTSRKPTPPKVEEDED